MQERLQDILKLAEAAAASFAPDLNVVDARITQQGRHRSLEITIHRPGGRISLDDCEAVSRNLEQLLDKENLSPGDSAYLLEVQSPGLERQLKSERDFQAFQGEPVEVKTKEPIEGLGWEFNGILSAYGNNKVVIANPQAIKPKSQSKHRSNKGKQPASDLKTPGTISIELSKVSQIKRQAISLAAPSPVTQETGDNN